MWMVLQLKMPYAALNQHYECKCVCLCSFFLRVINTLNLLFRGFSFGILLFHSGDNDKDGSNIYKIQVFFLEGNQFIKRKNSAVKPKIFCKRHNSSKLFKNFHSNSSNANDFCFSINGFTHTRNATNASIDTPMVVYRNNSQQISNSTKVQFNNIFALLYFRCIAHRMFNLNVAVFLDFPTKLHEICQ